MQHMFVIYREDEKYVEALSDLTEALKISPQNREMHKLVLKVREELQLSKNNNEEDGKPIGYAESESIKFLDDTSSMATDA